MKNILKYLAIALVLVTGSQSFAAIPEKHRTDNLQIGIAASGLSKNFLFDFGNGASNPSLGVNTSNVLSFNFNGFTIGDGANSINKDFTANIGNGSTNPKIRWNQSSSIWQFTNDGSTFVSLGAQTTPPTVQVLTSGSTYTRPSSLVRYLVVTIVGSGGGGKGSSTFAANDGSDGSPATGNTVFGSLASMNNGSPGSGSTPGAGGSIGSVSSPAIAIYNIPGSAGGAQGIQTSANLTAGIAFGGAGGVSCFGSQGTPTTTSGGAAPANFGGGGAGGSMDLGTALANGVRPGPGGGSGSCAKFVVPTPSATYSMSFSGTAAGGAGGTSGSAGGLGAAGRIVVEEYY